MERCIVLLGYILLCPAWADIYTYTDNSGKVYLSKAPANKQYRVLTATPEEHGGGHGKIKSDSVV
jgi:hypothetical protein